LIFVDSGAWFTLLIPSDPDHARVADWAARNREPLVTTDYVLDETLTLLRARGQNARAIAWRGPMLRGERCVMHLLTPDDLREAWDIFRTYADKEWSFTDCTSKVVMRRMGIRTAVALDHHFRQFGDVEIVP
jgi:predicted nucleic acid-binding protein